MYQDLIDRTWIKAFGLLIIVIVLICLWEYLAGGLFMIALDKAFDDATFLTFYQYWYYYHHHPSVARTLTITGCIAIVFTIAPFAIFFSPAKKSLYGEARFAKRSEIAAAGLLGEQGLIVGKLGGRYLMFGGSQHAIISAPTRGWKGVSVVIPNLLNWPDSVVVVDVKLENFQRTSKYRAKYGQECYLFNPVAPDYRTHRYNPLAYVSTDPNFRIDDIQKIANMLFPDKQGTDPIWTATPRSLFLGIVLYLLETPGKPVTIGQVFRESLANGDGAKYFSNIINARALGLHIKDTATGKAAEKAKDDLASLLKDKDTPVDRNPRLTEMASWMFLSAEYREAVEATADEDKRIYGPVLKALEKTPIDKDSLTSGKPLSGTCVRALNSYISIAAENTRGGIIGGFRSRLELWNNPLVDAATSCNDFDLRDVRKRRMSIYLGITPDNLDRADLAPLINLFFQQLIDLNTRELPERNKALKYQCLLLMDEFTAIGRIGILAKGISYIAGYGLRMMPIIQSPAQLVEVYGKDAAQTFQTNHALQIVFAPSPKEVQTAKDISEWLGYQTVKGHSQTRGKQIFGPRRDSESISDQRRALMLPQEIIALGQKRELVVLENVPPILANKAAYFHDPVFINRLKEVSLRLQALGRRIPTKEELDHAASIGELSSPVPTIDIEQHKSATGFNDVITIPAFGAPTRRKAFERPVTAEDMPQLSGYGLDDFAIVFSPIPIPEDLNMAALHEYADACCLEAGIALA